jgi:FkbM family methyltransferase
MVRRWWDEGGDYKYRFDYDLNRDSVVMDLGGYEGQWASDIYSRYRCRILVFEPVSSFANRIRERFRRNEDIAVFQYGLGSESRTETMYVRGAGSSTFRKRADAEEIRIVDAKSWFEENDVDSVQLMKINIEGGEFELLERLIETGLTERIVDIQVQFHNVAVDSTRRMESIQRKLQTTHGPTYQFKFVWENWTRKASNAG